MSETEYRETPEVSASTAVEEHNETTPSGAEAGVQDQDETQVLPLELKSSAGTSDSGEKPTPNGADRPVKLCLHVMEDGVFCQIPALSGRKYCYRHLRLRGQMMRMARAIAQRQPYQVVLPPLDDMHAVQAALAHVAAAMAAGLLERHRAGLLLYTLQQASSNLRFLARAEAQAQARSAGAPPLSPSVDDRMGSSGPTRVVQEYPEFEAEFGLPPGLDLTILPQVAFPPPEKAEKADTWAGLTTPQAHPKTGWTKEDIELEELEKRANLSEESYDKQSRKVYAKAEKKVAAELRKEREAEWEAEAARRNAEAAEKERKWQSMDPAQQRAYHEGVRTGYEAAQQQWQQESARTKKPAAKVSGEEAIMEMGKVAENEGG